MSLEAIEEKCIAYLQEVSNPLVPVDRLTSYLGREKVLEGMSESELLEFVKEHDQFSVIAPAGVIDNPAVALMMSAMDLNTKPYVILKSRVPSDADIAASLDDQLQKMTDALVTAAQEARDSNQEDRVQKIETMLHRITTARGNLKEAL